MEDLANQEVLGMTTILFGKVADEFAYPYLGLCGIGSAAGCGFGHGHCYGEISWLSPRFGFGHGVGYGYPHSQGSGRGETSTAWQDMEYGE